MHLECASEQLPGLELGWGLFGCFLRDLCFRLEDLIVYASRCINEAIASMGQCAKVTGDKQIAKTIEAKRQIKSRTR